MKVRITNLKGPWPTSAKVGDVVGISGDTIPGWAVGKCAQVEDDAEAQHEYQPRERVADESSYRPVTLTPAQQQDLEAQFERMQKDASELRDQLSSQGGTIQQLTDDLKASVRAEAELREQLASAVDLASTEKARADDLQAKLTAAEQAAVDAAANAGATGKAKK